MTRRPPLRALSALTALFAVAAVVFPAVADAAKSKKSVATTSLSPNKLVAAADAAEQSAGSLILSGNVSDSGSKVGFTLQLAGGGNGQGAFTDNGEVIQVVKLASDLYFNADKSFWLKNAGEQAASIYGGKWIEVLASNSNFVSFSQFMNPGSLVAQLFTGKTSKIRKGKTKKLLGQKVIPVSATTQSGGKSSKGTLYIATKGRPFVVELVATGGGESGVITFTHYGRSQALDPPSGAINLTGQGPSHTTTPPTYTIKPITVSPTTTTKPTTTTTTRPPPPTTTTTRGGITTSIPPRTTTTTRPTTTTTFMITTTTTTFLTTTTTSPPTTTTPTNP